MLSSTSDAMPSRQIEGCRGQALLNLRVVRGPLPVSASRTILDEYNRQTCSQIPFDEFVHWTQNSPRGPALHGILETCDGQIVGHQCLLPMAAQFGQKQFVLAKSEYTFLNEEFRSTKIVGHEHSRQPTHLIASRRLLEEGESMGWDPTLICTLPFLYRWARTIGCQALEFPVFECLLVLKPWDAAKQTLNLASWQRAALGITGIAQSVGWKPALRLARSRSSLKSILIHQECADRDAGELLTYFQDGESLRWRYPNGQYERIAAGSGVDDYLILKSGSQDGYLRVCQWSLPPSEPRTQLLLDLARHAEQKNAFGLRWAIYGTSGESRNMVNKMRKLGFLCARRVRTLLIRSSEKRFLDSRNWDLSDSMFSFHH